MEWIEIEYAVRWISITVIVFFESKPASWLISGIAGHPDFNTNNSWILFAIRKERHLFGMDDFRNWIAHT